MTLNHLCVSLTGFYIDNCSLRGRSHIIYDALRVGDPKQHGVPLHIMAFLWVCGWVPYIIGMLLLIVTWVSFSSKNLLARPALTGHPTLFWGLGIPFILASIISSLLCGVNYWWYWVSMRVAVAAWSAFFLIIALFAGYYGNQTLARLHKSRDSFNWKQQFRVLVAVVIMFVACGVCLGVQSYFLSRIDEIYQVFLLVTSLYRVCGFIVCIGSTVYVWHSTTHYVVHSGTRGTHSDKSGHKSKTPRIGSSGVGDSTEEASGEPERGHNQHGHSAATNADDSDSNSSTTSSDTEEENAEDAIVEEDDSDQEKMAEGNKAK